MNTLLGIVFVISSLFMLQHCGMAYIKTMTPIKLCLKNDFKLCIDVPYPNGCINLNTVNTTALNVTISNRKFVDPTYTIESVIVVDVDSVEEKCIALFDAYNCHGNALVLNGTNKPAANLHNFRFSNRAVSLRQCSKRLLNQLRDNPN